MALYVYILKAVETDNLVKLTNRMSYFINCVRK